MKTIVNDGIFNEQYGIELEPGKFVRLFGVYKNHVSGGKEYDITFHVGDLAEYDSYNLKYVGRIESIGSKTVTIKPGHRDRSRRLKLSEFAWRNWDFDIDRINEHNAIEMMCI